MKCNNEYCTWCSFDTCCHESEDSHENATPNELDCPSSLREDFEEQMYNLYEECAKELCKLNFKELNKVRKFIKSIGDDECQNQSKL